MTYHCLITITSRGRANGPSSSCNDASTSGRCPVKITEASLATAAATAPLLRLCCCRRRRGRCDRRYSRRHRGARRHASAGRDFAQHPWLHAAAPARYCATQCERAQCVVTQQQRVRSSLCAIPAWATMMLHTMRGPHQHLLTMIYVTIIARATATILSARAAAGV
jgi:hypothetical protein